MIGEQQVAFVAREIFDLLGTHVEKHLFRGSRHNLQWSIPYHRRRRSQQRTVPSNNRLDHAHGVFIRSAACVASAVVMIVGEQSTDFSIPLNSSWPIYRSVSSVWIGNNRTAADVFPNLPAIAAWIQCRDYSATVGSLPVPNIPGNTARCFFDRASSANGRGRIPRKLLRRDTFQTSVRENARQRCRETKTIGQHVLRAC